MKGITGSGQIGRAVGKRWAEAGHQILFSSRSPDELAPLVAEAGPNARADRDGPMAGDDAEAVAIAERLVRDAGFDPVYVGPLSDGRRFDRGTDVYVRGMTAAELRQAQNL